MAAAKPLIKTAISDELLHHEVVIDTPSRLHFTLIDLYGGLGRIDGGIGVALASPRIRINVRSLQKDTGGDESQVEHIPARVKPIVKKLKDKLGFDCDFNIGLKDSIPMHMGLGSNTQLTLAVAKAVTYFFGLRLPSSDLARLAGRGGTSGIGVATFECGGFVMDAGHPMKLKKDFLPSHYSDAAPPALIMRSALPEDWYFVMTTPFIGQGLHGEAEADVFTKYCPIPKKEVERLSHVILMKLLPAVAEEDILSFGEALTTIQSLGFKRIENELQHDVVKDLYDFYYANGALGAGLSSFGPTTYALVEGASNASRLKNNIERYLRDMGVACEVQYSNVDNNGSKMTVKS